MRKISKNSIRRLKIKADRLLQDWFRIHCPFLKCEICGKNFEVMHHFVEKSKSNYLRYHPTNLIPLCNFCHSKIQWDNTIQVKIALKMGDDWFSIIEFLKQIKRPPYTKKELMEIILAIKNSNGINELIKNLLPIIDEKVDKHKLELIKS